MRARRRFALVIAGIASLALATGVSMTGCKSAPKDVSPLQLASPAATRPATKGWPSRLLVNRSTLPASDRDFLFRLARDTWRGLDALTDEQTGLPWDHVVLSAEASGAVQAHPGDYVTTSSIGLYLVAIVAAYELGLIDLGEAATRAESVLDAIEGLETYEGYCFNFYETRSLRRASNFVSFVDSAWLSAGLIVARQALPSVAERSTRHLRQLDLGFFYDPTTQLMSHGYHADRNSRSPYHYGVFFTEARLGSLIALGKGEAPWQHWRRLQRDFAGCEVVSDSNAAEPSPEHERSRRPSSCRSWAHFQFVPSWGGSMFEALMPLLVFDESRHLARTLGANARTHALVQRAYAMKALGSPVWGFSPSAKPSDGYGYGEFGVPVLGLRGYPTGVVSPHATALALSVLPEDAAAGLQALAERYEIYGEFGFFDAVEPRSGRVVHAYLALDQAMLLAAVANHLEGGVLRRLFERDPIVESALASLRAGAKSAASDPH